MVLVLSGCGYNTLQSTDEDIKATWAEVLNQYQRRADLVPNLVNVVKGYAAHEQEVLTSVTEARARVGAIQATPELINDEAAFQKSKIDFPGQLTTGGYYKTLVSGAIDSFGWDMLLVAAAGPVKMEKVFDSFFRRTLFYMQAWTKTSAEVIIQHDDFVWTAGPFMNPDIYRKIIIPRYAKLWEPVHAAGKKLLFCSDGNYMEFAADIAEAGADGLIFEPCNDYKFMADNFGQTKCLVGSFVDCRDLTFGKKDVVLKCIERTFECLARCKGAIFSVGNHLPPNIPAEMLDLYFEHLLPRLKR